MKQLIWTTILAATIVAGQGYYDDDSMVVTMPTQYGKRIKQYLPIQRQDYVEYRAQYDPKSQQHVYLSNFNPTTPKYETTPYQYLPAYEEQFVQQDVEKQTIPPVYIEPETSTQTPIIVEQEPIRQPEQEHAQAMRRSDSFNYNQTHYSYMYQHGSNQENQTQPNVYQKQNQNQVQNSHAYIQPQQTYEPTNYVQREYKPINRQQHSNQYNQESNQYNQQSNQYNQQSSQYNQQNNQYKQQNNQYNQQQQYNQTSNSYNYQPQQEYTTMKPMYENNNYIKQQEKPYIPPPSVEVYKPTNPPMNNWNKQENKQDTYGNDFANVVYDTIKSNQAQPRNNYGNPVYGDRIIPEPPLYAMSRSGSSPIVNIPSNAVDKPLEPLASESLLQPTKYVPGVPSQFKPQTTMDVGLQQYAQQYTRNFNNQAYSLEPRTTTEGVPILKQMAEMEADGSFQYETLTGDQTHIVQQGHIENRGTDQEEQVMQGSYSFVGDNGVVYTVTYIADANGFRATGDHLPTAPPMPEAIQRAVEFNLAEEAAAEAFRQSQPFGQYSNNQLAYANPDQLLTKDKISSPSQFNNQLTNSNQPQAKERSSYGGQYNNNYNQYSNQNQQQTNARSSVDLYQYNQGTYSNQPQSNQYNNNQAYPEQSQQYAKDRSSLEYPEDNNRVSISNQNQYSTPVTTPSPSQYQQPTQYSNPITTPPNQYQQPTQYNKVYQEIRERTTQPSVNHMTTLPNQYQSQIYQEPKSLQEPPTSYSSQVMYPSQDHQQINRL